MCLMSHSGNLVKLCVHSRDGSGLTIHPTSVELFLALLSVWVFISYRNITSDTCVFYLICNNNNTNVILDVNIKVKKYSI